jgi:hypothetical protein
MLIIPVIAVTHGEPFKVGGKIRRPSVAKGTRFYKQEAGMARFGADLP